MAVNGDKLVTLNDLKAKHEYDAEQLKNKVDKASGKALSTNDYTDAAKKKVDAIPANPKYTDTVYDETKLKKGDEANKDYHLGFYLDADGILCQEEKGDNGVCTDDTMRNILGALSESRMYVKNIAQQAKWNPSDITTMKNISDAGLARRYFNVGDQVTVNYTDTAGNNYDMPWDVVHIGDAVLADGSIKHDAIYLQSHYLTVEAIQFDKEEKEKATEEKAISGLYYYGFDGTNYTLLDIKSGAVIPYSDYTEIYHNAVKDTSLNILKYGYNRELHSAYLQWLNSPNKKGEWWKPQHIGDCAPDQAANTNGFMAGLPKDFIDAMAHLQITQFLNTVSEPDKTLTKDTFDAKLFLPRLEQLYINPQAAGEGEAWDYYKELATGAGLTGTFQRGQTYPILISYGLNAKTTPYYQRLGSANRGASCSAWNVVSSGYVGYGNVAYSANRCRPACVI